MQHGGSWDNSNIRGSRKVNWLKSDKEYASDGYKKEQSVSIFGYGQGLDWTGNQSRNGGPGNVSVRANGTGKNYRTTQRVQNEGSQGVEKQDASRRRAQKEVLWIVLEGMSTNAVFHLHYSTNIIIFYQVSELICRRPVSFKKMID